MTRTAERDRGERGTRPAGVNEAERPADGNGTSDRQTERKSRPEKIWAEYQAGVDFKNQINLYSTVDNNENFFIGKQWEGVQSNGLPTPVFNMIKRIILFQVASTSTDNLKINAAPMNAGSIAGMTTIEQFCNVLNAQFEAIWEHTKSAKKTREFMRDAAVRGDGCLYSWFDPDVETGQQIKGAIETELLPNTRVIFGNPTDREIQNQPYIIVERRELVRKVKKMAEENGGDGDLIQPDTDTGCNRFDNMTDNKTTVLYKFRRDEESGTIWCSITTQAAVIRADWDTKQALYPLVWMSWDHVTECYHGMAAVTGLIPNQIFVNKMFAMVYLSLMTTAYPKVVYDKTRVAKWDSSVGSAIAVNGGDINTVAKTIDPATISPQVGEFINMTVGMTKDLMGATDAALGSTRPDNTSAIIALQKAANVPQELVKQDFLQCIEDMARIWTDLMRCYYGKRVVEMELPQPPAGMGPQLQNPDQKARMQVEFDFSQLDTNPISVKLDVGGSAYWSEIAQLQTLDNLLMNNRISTADYLRRLPSGYINMQQELIQKMDQAEALSLMQEPQGQPGRSGTGISPENVEDVPVEGGPGNRALQRNLIEAAAAGSGR